MKSFIDTGTFMAIQAAAATALDKCADWIPTNVATFKERLEEKGIPYSNYGAWAIKGWEQIFFHDPEGNVIEVHQANE